MTSQLTHPETTIEADPALPTVKIVREFDFPRDQVFRAYTEPELVTQWLGPRSLQMEMDHWDCSTGGSYRYTHRRGEEEYRFYGSFHEVRDGERIVQTFTFDGAPDGVSLETATFTDAGEGRTRLTLLSVVESMEIRDAMIASGMETGVVEGFEQLDELLAGKGA